MHMERQNFRSKYIKKMSNLQCANKILFANYYWEYIRLNIALLLYIALMHIHFKNM
jgi:hypothetical protein